jgi:hypothetical protein
VGVPASEVVALVGVVVRVVLVVALWRVGAVEVC